MKHVGTTVLMILVAVGLSHAAAAKEVCNVLPEPAKKMLGLEIEQFGGYEDPKIGIGLVYASESERLSLFRFDAGLETIDDDSFAKYFRSAVSAVYEGAKIEGQQLLDPIELPDVEFLDFRVQNLLMLDTREGYPIIELLGMGHDGLCMTKIRYTNSQETNDLAEVLRYFQLLHALERYLRGTDKP